LVRVATALVLEDTGYSTRLAPDEETYFTEGWRLAHYWSGEVLVLPKRFHADAPLGYFYLNAGFIYLFGDTDVPLRLVNALIGASSCVYIYLLARGLFGPTIGLRAAKLFQFFPSLILWSAVNIRDIWVVALIVYASWKSYEVMRGYSHRALFSLVAALYGITLFRDYLFYIVALPPVIAFLIGARGHLVRNFTLSATAALAVVLLVQQGAVAETTHRRMSLEALSEMRRDYATGGSAFHEQVDISTPGRALAFLPIGVLYFLFSPFPWQITSFLKALSLPEMLIVYCLFPAIIRGLFHTLRQRFRESLQILLVTGLLTVSYALGEGNVGTLYRHRAQVIGFYLVFAAVGMEVARQASLARAA
jgi:4-amino-4-deoxy-L-arabinose transferase-like glycosyltransferase